MNELGANEDDMRFFTKLSEREFDGILAGKAPGGELEDVAAFFRELRVSLEEAPSPSIEDGHLAAIIEEARDLHPFAPEPQITPSLGPRLRRPRLAARAPGAAVGRAAPAPCGGAAYAGALPAPVQSKVADIARNVGISLPGNDHRSKQRGGGQDTGETGQTNVGRPAHSNGGQSGDQSGGDQSGDRSGGDQSGGDQSGGDDGTSTNDNQSGQTTTVQGVENEQGTGGAQNEQGTPSGGSGAGDGNQNG